MPKWSVTVNQVSKQSGNALNNFTFTVFADNKDQAKEMALNQIAYWNMYQPNHVLDGVYTDYEVRTQRKLTWGANARNIITAIKQIT